MSARQSREDVWGRRLRVDDEPAPTPGLRTMGIPLPIFFFQLALLAYNLNCWLMLFQREEEATVETLAHTTLATARLKLLFLAARIWSHAGRVGVSYSDHYAEQPLFNRLTTRLRSVTARANELAPVIATPLRC